MGHNTTRLAIENVVKNSLAKIEDNPERSLRNLVDMALQFAKSDNQKVFFKTIQKMLSDEKSGYYILARDVIHNVDKDKIQRFGINLGYNGCILGINKIIKSIKENKGKRPWIENIDISKNLLECDKLIKEGENLGTYIWTTFTVGDDLSCLNMATNHKESAFIIFVKSKEITDDFIKRASKIDNIMVVISYDEATCEISDILRKEKMLYSIYYEYNQKDYKRIKDGEMIEIIQMLHPLFSFFIASKNVNQDIKKDVYKSLCEARDDQVYNTILFDLYGDLKKINNLVYLE